MGRKMLGTAADAAVIGRAQTQTACGMRRTVAALTLCCAVVGCGGGHHEDRPQGSALVGADEATLKPSPQGRRAGREACRAVPVNRALSIYLARAKRSTSGATRTTRRALIAQASAMPPSARRSSSAAPVAAALFALSQPKAMRSGAFQGCLSVLQKETSR